MFIVKKFCLICFCCIVTMNSVTYLLAQDSFEKKTLQIITEKKRVHFQVEQARTTAQRERGLMYRRYLKDNAGMLFHFGSPRVVNMWMKDTYISLDMIFIDSKNEIVHIVTDTQPHDLTLISSVKEVIAVLEVKAGTVRQEKIKIGNTVIF